MGTDVDRLDLYAALLQQLEKAGMDQAERLAGEEAAGEPRLVRDDHGDVAGRDPRPQALRDARQQLHPVGGVAVRLVADEGSVPIEEDRGALFHPILRAI